MRTSPKVCLYFDELYEHCQISRTRHPLQDHSKMVSYAEMLAYAFAAHLLWTAYGAVWRLFLSPIAKFPGSKLAAVTFWYEFYYDAVKGGAYVYEIERMHKQYGT